MKGFLIVTVLLIGAAVAAAVVEVDYKEADETGALKFLQTESTTTGSDPPGDETVLADLTLSGTGGDWWHRTDGDAGIVVAKAYSALMIVGSDQGTGRGRWTRMWDTVSIEGRLILGWKWTLSGVGDAHGNDGWLRLFGVYPSHNTYYGGFATSKVWSYAYHYGSDRNLKENITPVTSALSKLKMLNGVTYNWKKEHAVKNGVDPTTETIGLIAQDVQAQFPEAVATGANGFLAVDYGKIVAPIVEAIKEHHDETLSMQKELSEHVSHTTTLEQIAMEQGERLAELERKLVALLP